MNRLLHEERKSIEETYGVRAKDLQRSIIRFTSYPPIQTENDKRFMDTHPRKWFRLEELWGHQAYVVKTTVQELLEKLQMGGSLPNIRVGYYEGKPYIEDGYHRTQAQYLFGRKKLLARVW